MKALPHHVASGLCTILLVSCRRGHKAAPEAGNLEPIEIGGQRDSDFSGVELHADPFTAQIPSQVPLCLCSYEGCTGFTCPQHVRPKTAA